MPNLYFEVHTTDNYEKLKKSFKLTSGDLLDDRLPVPFKNFECGSVYIFVCIDAIDVVIGGINIDKFANIADEGIPLEMTGLVTTECCVSSEQLPTPLINRYQFAWYGICSNCSNQKIEEILNGKPEYREYITDIIKYSSDGAKPLFYKVRSVENYEKLRNSFNLNEDEYLDEKLPVAFKEFKCAALHIIVCKNSIDTLEQGILIPNLTTNNPNARISRCNVAGTIQLGLQGHGCEEPISVKFPSNIPTYLVQMLQFWQDTTNPMCCMIGKMFHTGLHFIHQSM